LGHFLLSIASAETISWIGFVTLGLALVGEVAVILIPPKWERLHKELAFGFAVLAAGGYAVERVGDEAIMAALQHRADVAETSLKKLTADRVPTADQIGAIVKKLSAFSGQEYQMVTFWDMREPLALANRVHSAMQSSGWKYIPYETATMMLGGIEGIQVWVHPAADGQVRKAANTLMDALNSADLAAVLKEQNPKNPKDNKIGISVGTKP